MKKGKTRKSQTIKLNSVSDETFAEFKHSEDWLDDEDPLTIQEKALLEARLAAYAKDPDAGSTWEEVEGRIRARLSRQPNG